MCIVHMIKYTACKHTHSYAEIVHDDPIYCANQQVIDDGVSKERDKCPDCIQRDQTVLFAMRESAGPGRPRSDEANPGERRGQAADLESQMGSESIVTDGLEFVENYVGDGPDTQDLGSSYGSGLADSRTEWQLVPEADIKENEIPGVEDEVVIVKYGKDLREALAVDGETELVAQVQVLGLTAVDRQELNAKENDKRSGFSPRKASAYYS
jgi:hypothetical protein